MQFDVRVPLGRLDEKKIADALGRVGNLPGFGPPRQGLAAEGWVYRTVLPARTDLLAVTVRGFDAIAAQSGPTEQWLPRVLQLIGSLQGTWFEEVGRYSVAVSFTPSYCRLSFVNQHLKPEEGWKFVSEAVERLKLPVTLIRETFEATHANGLYVMAEGQWNGLELEIPPHDVPAVLQYVAELRALARAPVKETAWVFRPADDADASQAYDALAAASLAAKSVTLSYEFVPPELSLVPVFRALCVKAKDNFRIPIGTYAAFDGISADLVVDVNGKGFQPVMAIDTTVADEDDFPSKRMLQDARSFLAETLGVPAK
jgi:hypothetical protein